MTRIAVLGPHIVDVLGRPVTEIPPGQGGVLLEEIRMTVAGTGGGAAVDLAKLGWEVSSFAAVGADGLGVYLRSQLDLLGVDTRGLISRPGELTSSTILPIRPNGERPSLHVLGATASLRVDDVDWDAIASCGAVLLGGPETMPALLEPAGLDRLRAVRAGGVKVFVDFLHGGDTAMLESLADLWPLIDWLMPNDDQLRNLTGHQELSDAAGSLVDRGVGGVAVTQGGEGALLVRPGVPDVTVPAFATTVVDTTGCGDSFNAGMITGILHGCRVEDAALIGCACGSLVASGLGSDAGIVDLAGVLDVVRGQDPQAADRIAVLVS
ncbi:sugar kinase [Kineosporia mesophila]|uniref:Sugar kinase n=1 Tax=Kineosporia mesophila TaxID=566012 RepID=A0ABP6Z6Z1_9ACTN|nr:sugar kinase [Kineosporia mesophila]MCD5352658.1 sugar kinase [Kineosporia mesophila]